MIFDEELIWVDTPHKTHFISEKGDIINKRNFYKLNPCISPSGYLMVDKNLSYSRKSGGLHRIVYESFIGVIPEGLQINHMDGDKTNNHISNLELCTPSENTIHAYTTGLARGRKGEENHNSKLTELQVKEIYTLFEQGYTNDFIAKLYQIHSRYVSLIRHGKRWKYLYDETRPFKASVGNLPFSLAKCVYIFNKCIRDKRPQKVLGDELSIDPSTVSRIRTGATWKSLRKFYEIPTKTLNWKDECVACES